MLRTTSLIAVILALLAVSSAFSCRAQSASGMGNQDEQLLFAVYLSRHGVRSPSGDPAQYHLYSAAPWPAWSVPPGYLTAHGYRLMRIFGAWDREQLAGEGLLAAAGCGDAAGVTIYADSDQRTRETGKALAEGLFPGCAPQVLGMPEGSSDPLFHPHKADSSSALAVAAVSGSIGGSPANLTDAYRAQLTELDSILSKCGDPPASASLPKRQSILEIPATLERGSPGHSAELHGPLNTASTLTENFLLEYTEGMDASNVGWGCVNGENLRSLLELHTAASEYLQRPIAVARTQASNLLHQIELALAQAATRKPVTGAISRVNDRALFLIGHDTNIATMAGLLDLHWIADGQPDGIAPGGALVFELWRSRSGNRDSIRVFYTTQTLEQMRSESALSTGNPPARVPVFLPSCSQADFSCSISDFEKAATRAIAQTN